MNTERNITSEEMSFSIALTSGALLSILKSVKFVAKEKGADPAALQLDQLIELLERLFNESAAMSGPEYMSMGRERSKELFHHILELSRPVTIQ